MGEGLNSQLHDRQPRPLTSNGDEIYANDVMNHHLHGM